MDIFEDIVPHTSTLELLHPATNEPVGIRLELRSMDSPEVKRVEKRITDEKLKLSARNKNFKADDVEEHTLNLYVAAIAGWEWDENARAGGEQLAFNAVNVRKVLSVAWISKQVDDALGETKRFFTT